MYINPYQYFSMYFYLFISICIFLSGQICCFAQDTVLKSKKLEIPSYFNVTKTNPFTPLWGNIPFTAEYRIVQELATAKKQSLEISASYLGKSLILTLLKSFDTTKTIEKLTVGGIRFQIAYKLYLSSARDRYAPEGFYIAPHLSYSYANISNRFLRNKNEYLQIVHFNTNMLCGYQFIILDDFIVDLFCGIGYKKNNWYEYDPVKGLQNFNTDDMGFFYNSPVKFILGFNVGVAY